MKREIQAAAWAVAGVMVSALTAGAAEVGSDTFTTYPDGPIAGRAGGTGWTAERTDEPAAPPSAPSDWNGDANIVLGRLITHGTTAKREYNGLTEGDGPASNEREGAFPGTGQVFYAVDILRFEGADWSGASSYDFNNERIFFGVPSGQGANAFFGIEESGVGRTMTTLPAQNGRIHRMVAEVDFDNDKLNLWIDPRGSSLFTPDATRAYTGSNWSTAVRLGSGATNANGDTVWNNLVVATDWNDVVAPEPSTLCLGAIGALAMLRRRR